MRSTVYELVLARDAERRLNRLSRYDYRRIRKVMDELAQNPRPKGAEKLKGRRNGYRIRIGDYRVLYEVSDDEGVVRIIRVGHRREVYRRR